MARIRSRSLSRRGFTLIELLVVIAIIAVLVSLTAAGTMKMLGKIPQVQTSTEMSQLDSALAAFMSDYQLSDPPPSHLILSENLALYPAGDPNLAFLKRTFGKNLGAATGNLIDWNGNGALDGPWTLEGEQCLIFYTGGIPTPTGSTPGGLGFSTNNMNPAAAGGKRNGPYMTFKSSRLVAGAGGFFVYIDPWKSPTSPLYATLGGTPYAYFSSFGINNLYTADCPSIFATPYSDGSGHFINSNKYQIISAGQDGVFGPGVLIGSSGATGSGRDDQANFSSTILGAGQN